MGPRQAKAKFTVIHPSGKFAKFKAASQHEADEWMNQLTSAAARVRYSIWFTHVGLLLTSPAFFEGQGS